MSGGPVFFILKPSTWLPSSNAPSLLGYITKNFRSPLSNSIPSKVSPTIYNDFELQENTFHDFEISNSQSSSVGTYAKLQGLAGLKFARERDSQIGLNGKTISFQRLRQLDQIWLKLKDNDEVKETVVTWLKTPKVYPCWITGIFLCFDSKQSDSSRSQISVR
jgi:hypothetical protein